MSANQPKKQHLLDRLADESGLAIVIADENFPAVSEANNNSLCRALYASEEFAPHCAQFCGRAFAMAHEAGTAVGYECYAGLSCRAVPFESQEKKFVAIVGRTFLKAANYRRATERAIAGDWNKFPPTKFFENVLLSSSDKTLEKAAAKIARLDEKQKIEISGCVVKTSPDGNAAEPDAEAETPARGTAAATELPAAHQPDEAEELAARRALFSLLFKLSYKKACALVLDFLAKRYDLSSMIWLERKENRLEKFLATGDMREGKIQIGVAADDERLNEAARSEKPLELRERQNAPNASERRSIYVFPVAVGGEIRSALAVGGALDGQAKKRLIADFCRAVASELEILRLREKLSERDWLRRAVTEFNENLKKIDADDFWQNLTRISAELLRSERASLLIYNEKTDALQAKAALGAPEQIAADEPVGDRVAQSVLRKGEPLIVGQINRLNLPDAPANRQYRTESFISYPIAIGERKIGVLNFTDRADREKFGAADLEILRQIAPQIAVMVDRASLKEKAGQFEQLSVTDALTGLLNRRYLEERLLEEIKRSNRHGFPMSFMMIDVDDFKSFNDNFGHAEGDRTLKTVAAVLKDSLRGADVAARYGGEEFSILLPQTNIEEAETIAERIRRRIEETDFSHRKVTISVGIADCSLEINSPHDLISAADKALYDAKRGGRNRVRVYGSLEA